MKKPKRDDLNPRFRSELMRACMFVGLKLNIAPSMIYGARPLLGGTEVNHAQVWAWFLVCGVEGSDVPLEIFIPDKVSRGYASEKISKLPKTCVDTLNEYRGWRRGL